MANNLFKKGKSSVFMLFTDFYILFDSSRREKTNGMFKSCRTQLVQELRHKYRKCVFFRVFSIFNIFFSKIYHI